MPFRSALLLLALSGCCAMLSAQPAPHLPPELGGRTGSLGQPTPWSWLARGAAGWDSEGRIEIGFGAQRQLLNPLLGLAAVHGEMWAGTTSAASDAGLRLRVISPLIRVGAGAEHRIGDGRLDLLLSAFHPVRRGGVFRDGSVLRLDYVPARGAVTLGIDRPVFDRRAGRGRPRNDHIRLPPGRLPPAAAGGTPAGSRIAGESLARAAAAAARIRLHVLPLGPVPARAATDTSRVHAAVASLSGENSEESVRAWHTALDDAFSAAAPGLSGSLAQAARESLLEHVLLPYNRLLGQVKKPDRLDGLAARAYGGFDRWLQLEAGLPADGRQAALDVFRDVLRIIEDNRAAIRAQWRDSRFVWLPLQYALLPEDHDTQAELDALVERAVAGTRFSEGNFVSYLVNEQYQYHLSRTIQEARDYHVLWTHDFRGLDAGGEIDEMAYRHVLVSYLGTLTARVREYDSTGRMPVYLIVLDQWFYEVNGSRLWMSLLEDPLRYELKLPHPYGAWADSIAAAQQALRSAVAGSALLQSRARRHGDRWLRDLVKVHVNITNPGDASFWSTGVVRRLPLPDNMMRDHRKIVFYDVSEEDPYRGAAILTGAGIGEHYANLSWEDRSLLMRGPALLPLKAALRELLLAQGLPAGQLPRALLPRPMAQDYDDRIRTAMTANQQPLRALQLHNGAGFAAKDVNLAKAVLYTLMPPGSVLKIPDSLWNSDFWGSLLLGCALRGGRVLIIAPAAPNAPADAFGTLGRSREMLTRLLTAARALEPEIDAAGGLLRVGFYDTELEVTDLGGKIEGVVQAFRHQQWLSELFGFRDFVLGEVPDMAAMASGVTTRPAGLFEFEHDTRPKLHFKANYFASAEAWTLLQRPEWSTAAWAYMQLRMTQIQTRSASIRTFTDGAEPIADTGGGMVLSWLENLADASRSRVIFYTLMGSHNQNSRSMVIDAEVGLLLSGWPAIIPYIDLVVLIGQTRWVDGPDQVAEFLPLDTGWRRSMAHWFRLAL
jgi:hypothetical protein